MATKKYTVELEIDTERNVLYVHATTEEQIKGFGTPTIVRIKYAAQTQFPIDIIHDDVHKNIAAIMADS